MARPYIIQEEQIDSDCLDTQPGTAPRPAAPTARPAENPEDVDQFLKPADESETVTWSSETSADILF